MWGSVLIFIKPYLDTPFSILPLCETKFKNNTLCSLTDIIRT